MPRVAARLPGMSRRDPMRAVAAIAAVQVSVTRFGVWRAAVAAAIGLVWLVVLSWVASHALARGGVPPVAVGGVAVVALASASFLAWRLAAIRPFALRWDGACWFVSTATDLPAAADGVPGDLVAMLDLGPWMLLRFTPERRPAAAVPVWLPLQRRGLEASWHALRCAVHAPPRAPAADAAVGDH